MMVIEENRQPLLPYYMIDRYDAFLFVTVVECGTVSPSVLNKFGGWTPADPSIIFRPSLVVVIC